MFEKLLQKVIMSYFGDYLNGIDANNLHVGIWNGDIRIQNVSLNEQKINNLMIQAKLPFQLLFSHIGGLRVVVPWNKLSSMPVQATLTDVYLFLRMKETDSKVELKDIILNKKDLIKNYCQYLSTKLLGEKKQDKEAGYLNKMIAKIIDNIQLKIENIHIRVQGGEEVEEVFYSMEEEEDNTVMINEDKSKSFAFGFCIKSINAYTTDQEWNKRFVDRSENKYTQMRKKLFFEQISLYWEEKDVVPMTSLRAEDTRYLMSEIISRGDKRLLTISGQIKFIEVKDKTKPQYTLTTTFEVLKVQMSFKQLKGIIELGQKISEYKTFQKAINLHLLPQEQQLQLQSIFKNHIKYQFNNKFQKMPEEFENILVKVNKQNLIKWTKQSITSIIKKKKIELKEKEKNQKKWWNILSYQEIKITQQEEEEIGKLMNEMISSNDGIEREANSPWIALNVEIIKGSVAVLHSQIQQLFYLQYQNMIINFSLLKNKKHFSLNLILQKSSLKYIKHQKQHKTADEIINQRIQLCQIEIIKQKDLNRNLIELFISKQQLLVDVKFVTRKVEINYQTRIILLIKQLMKVRNNDQVNSVDWNTMAQKIQQKTKQNERNKQESKQKQPKIEYKINVDIEGVYIIILLEENQHLVASFNKIWIKDIDANNKKGCIENLNVRYISKTKADVNNLRYSQLGSQEIYLIHPLNPLFSLEVTEIKNNIRLEIGSINLNMNKTQIVKIRSFIDKQLEIGDQQKKRPYKQIAQQQSQKSGYVKILNTFKTWKKYYAILTQTYIQFYEQDEYIPIVKWFIKNCVITDLSENKLKLQSSSLNEIIECKDQQQKNEWKSKIQEVVITNTSGEELYEMFDELELKSKPSENLELKQTIFTLQIEQLELIFQQQKPVLRLYIGQLIVNLIQSKYFFNRSITIDKFEIADLRQSKDSQYYSIIKSNTYSNIHQFNKQQSSRLELKIHGKKKFHPNYKSELFIKGSLGGITINFNPRILLHFIRLLGKKKAKYQFGEKSQRQDAIFGYTKNFLLSNFFQELEQSIQSSKNIENKTHYTKFNEFQQSQKVLVMLDVDFSIKSMRINLIHRTTKCCNNTIVAENMSLNIKNGNSFMFIEIELLNAKIFDLSNYPNTINNFENESEMIPYELVSPSKPNAAIKVWFSTFQNYVFTNLQRTTGFFLLSLDDYTIMYQQQPFMRFIDYLNNQLISFLLKPYSVDIYEYKYNKEFKFSEYEQFTTKQVEKIIEGLLLPFFTSLTVEVNNSVIHFNSHPGLESLVLNVEKIVVQSKDLFTNNRIQIDDTKLKQCRQRKNFKDLQSNKIFDQRILKGCWVQQMIISLKNVQMGNNTSPFNLVIDFERLPNGQRFLLFPFIIQDKTMMLSGEIDNLQLKLTKQFYNLLLKCMIHNLTHDDGKDSLYQHNFKYQHLMQPSPMSNLIKIKEGNFMLPEIEARMHVKNLEYWFVRDQNQEKKMLVKITRLELFKRDEQIVMKDWKVNNQIVEDEYDLEYQFTSEKNFDKKMTVKCNNLRLFAFDLDIFKKIGTFVGVPAECFPDTGVLGDMPMITCTVQLNNSVVAFAYFDAFAFVAEGDITYTWNRNRSRHYDLIKQDRVNGIKVPDVGVTTSQIIQLKGLELKKVSNEELILGKALSKQKVRKLSTPISVFLRLKDKLKFSPNHTIYYDKQISYSLESVGIIMSYQDISEIIGFFSPPSNPQIQQQPPQQPQQFNPYEPSTTTQHNLIIYNVQFQILASSPQAPLMSIHLNDGKLKCTQMRNMIPLHSLLKVGIHYYNLKVGVWEPVLEQVEVSVEMKWGTEKYLRVECKQTLLIDISVEFIKLLKLLLADISSINQQKSTIKSSIATKRQTYQAGKEQLRIDTKINNTSPYIIINNLGCQLTIQSSQGSQKYVLQPCQSINYQTQSEVISSNQPKKVKLIINDGKSIHQIHDIDLDKIKNKLMRMKFADREVDIQFIAVYREIIKQIIISSCYLIRNSTTFDIELQANDKILKIKRGEESALPYTLLFEECTFSINFPHLEDVKENFAFSSEVIVPHYQHYILAANQIFNCNIEPEQDESSQITSIVISPLFVFRNSLPCNIKIQLFWKVNGVEKRIEDELGIQEQKGYHQIGSRDQLEVKIKLPGFHFSQSQVLYDPNNKQYQPSLLQLNDYRGNTGQVNLKCSKRNRVKRYTFYSTGLIINQTNYQLYFYDSGLLIPGQKLQSIGEENRLCFIGDLKQLNISTGDDNSNRSQNPLSSTLELIQLGSNNFEIIHKHKRIEFGTYTDLYCIDAKESLYSRIIQITPKYIIVNKCSFPLKVKHYQSDKSQNIGVEQKTPLEWDNRYRTKHICVKMESEGKKWAYSEPIDFEQNSSIISFVLRSQNKKEQKSYMRMEVVKELQYQYLIISQILQEKDYLISVHNQLAYVRIELYQKIIDEKQPVWDTHKDLKLQQNGAVEQYGFDYPNQSKETVVTFKFIGPLRSDYDDYTFTVDLSQQSYSTQLTINSNVRQKQIVILVTIESIAGKRNLKFTQKNENNDHQELDEFVLLRLGISFKGVGISVIGETRGKRCQIIYLTMKQCQLMLLQKSTIRTLQLKIKYINIDNNSNHNSSNPVFFTPQKEQKAMKSPRPFLLFLLEQNLKLRRASQIKSIRVSIQPTSIRFDDQFFEVIRGFVKQINNGTIEIQQTDLIPIISPDQFAWNNRDLKSLTSETFVQQFQIAKITLQLSFSMRPKGSGSSSNQLIYMIIKSFGVLIAKISDSYVTFSRIIFIGKNMTQIKKQIMSRYYKHFSKTIISVIASVNFLGNPFKIIRYIGQGFVDVINHPVQGFIKGPIEGVFGIIGGGVGFLKNIVAGTFIGLESVSESVSSGLSSLSMDEKFIQRREKIKNHQTKHLGSGTVYGLYSIIGGVELAITGLYRQPVEGYNNNGVLGGIAGTLKALTGVFIKPLSGAFEGMSKFSEGIKNTALMLEDGPKTQRQRPPRIFYGQEYIYKSYDQEEAQSVAALQYMSTKYLNIVILELISFDSQDNQQGNMLLISSSCVCLFNRKKKKIYWDEQVNKISHVRIRQGAGVIIHTKQKQQLFIETSKSNELMQKLMLAVKLNERMEELEDD